MKYCYTPEIGERKPVAPCAGAWVEISTASMFWMPCGGRPLCGGVG